MHDIDLLFIYFKQFYTNHNQLRTYITVWCKDRDFYVTFVAQYVSQG